MISFDKLLEEELKDPDFAKSYKEEYLLLGLSIKINEIIQEKNISKKDLAKNAKVTQKQLSKLIWSDNYKIKTLIRVCNTLGLKIDLISTNSIE